MNYEEFVQLHPWGGFIFECLKILVSVLLSLLAIRCENKRYKRSDKIKSIEKRTEKIYTLYEEIYRAMYKMLKAFRDIEPNKFEELDLENYYHSIKEIKIMASSMNHTFDIEVKIYGTNKKSFNDVKKNLYQNFDDINELIEAQITNGNKDFKRFQDRIATIVAKIQTDLYRYAEEVSNEIISI